MSNSLSSPLLVSLSSERRESRNGWASLGMSLRWVDPLIRATGKAGRFAHSKVLVSPIVR